VILSVDALKAGRNRVRKRVKHFGAIAWAAGLRKVNERSRRSVLGDVPVTVSLTSHGDRVADAALAIESIAAGRRRPERLVLWLDDPVKLADLPPALRRLQQRGLEVLLSKNYGPHTKYFPALEDAVRAEQPLVTADDDILYPRYWLDLLWRRHQQHPEDVVCYRACVVRFAGDDRLAPYRAWPMCRTTSPSLLNLATGVSGVIYPVPALRAVRQHGTQFASVCPTADDLWLHWCEATAGIRVRQALSRPRHFPIIPGSQGVALLLVNVGEDGNDAQLAALYRDTEIDVLRSAVRAESPS